MNLRMVVEFVKKDAPNDEIKQARVTKSYKGLEHTHTVADIYKVTEHAFQELKEQYHYFDLRDAHLKFGGVDFNIVEIQMYCFANKGGYNITVSDILNDKYNKVI